MMSFAEIDHALDLITTNGARTLHIEDTYVSRRGRTRASSCSTRRCRSRRSASARACCGSVRRGEELFTRVPAQMRSKYDLLA